MLAKDHNERWQSASDLASELKWITESSAQTTGVAVPRATPKFRERVAWLIAAIALVAALGLLSFRVRTDTASHEVMHLDISYPPGVEPLSALQGGFAISPDGRTTTMIGVKDGVRRLFVRRLDRADAVEINGAAGVNTAGFSPDSKSVIFVAGTANLTRLSLEDQQRSVVAPDVDLTTVLACGEAGIIYTRGGTLWITSTQGGAGKQLTTLDEKRHEVLHTDPLVLPGGRTILFSSIGSEVGTERIEAVPASGGQRTVVIDHAITPVWSLTGHLLFGRDGAVLAVPFDSNRVSVRGTAIPIIPAGIVNKERSGAVTLLARNSSLISAIVNPAFRANSMTASWRSASAAKCLCPFCREARVNTPAVS